jgi:hypothetical protein
MPYFSDIAATRNHPVIPPQFDASGWMNPRLLFSTA